MPAPVAGATPPGNDGAGAGWGGTSEGWTPWPVPTPDVADGDEAKPKLSAAAGDEGPLGPRPVGAPGPFEPACLRATARTVEAVLVGPAWVTLGVMVLAITPEPAWAGFCETVRAAPEAMLKPVRATLEPVWTTVWVMLETLAVPLTVRVTGAVVVDMAEPAAEPASWVMFETLCVALETLFVACVTTPVTVAALVTVAAVALFTASVTGAAALVTVVVATEGKAWEAWVAAAGVAVAACAAVAAGATVEVVAGATVEVVAGAEEISCEAVPETLPSAPVTGAAALDSSASARVPGSAHRAATTISRAIRRSVVHAEGLRALPSMSRDCGGFAQPDALVTRSAHKSSQIA